MCVSTFPPEGQQVLAVQGILVVPRLLFAQTNLAVLSDQALHQLPKEEGREIERKWDKKIRSVNIELVQCQKIKRSMAFQIKFCRQLNKYT